MLLVYLFPKMTAVSCSEHLVAGRTGCSLSTNRAKTHSFTQAGTLHKTRWARGNNIISTGFHVLDNGMKCSCLLKCSALHIRSVLQLEVPVTQGDKSTSLMKKFGA